jgi:hypothetical protein
MWWVTDQSLGGMQKGHEGSQNDARLLRRIASDYWKGQMSYLLNVANERPMLRTAATVIVAFCCAAPFVLLFSSLVVYGVRSLIH